MDNNLNESASDKLKQNKRGRSMTLTEQLILYSLDIAWMVSYFLEYVIGRKYSNQIGFKITTGCLEAHLIEL
jgi:hypothetical protein